MTVLKEFIQWLFWFVCFVILFVETTIYSVPVLSHFGVSEANPFSEYYSVWGIGWTIIAFTTMVWWTMRGQKFKGLKDL